MTSSINFKIWNFYFFLQIVNSYSVMDTMSDSNRCQCKFVITVNSCYVFLSKVYFSVLICTRAYSCPEYVQQASKFYFSITFFGKVVQ